MSVIAYTFGLYLQEEHKSEQILHNVWINHRGALHVVFQFYSSVHVMG